ncbi:MAG TPA: hypothetical protein PK402_06375 [Tepidisphaeraceae bacterium]|nr:hypothetical protein [Tepidisphaeraceae bacterium]
MRNGIVKASKSKPIVKPFNVGDIVAITNGVGVDAGGIVTESNESETFWRNPRGVMESQPTREVYLVARGAGVNGAPLPTKHVDVAIEITRLARRLSAIARSFEDQEQPANWDDFINGVDGLNDYLPIVVGNLLWIEGEVTKA